MVREDEDVQLVSDPTLRNTGAVLRVNKHNQLVMSARVRGEGIGIGVHARQG